MYVPIPNIGISFCYVTIKILHSFCCKGERVKKKKTKLNTHTKKTYKFFLKNAATFSYPSWYAFLYFSSPSFALAAIHPWYTSSRVSTCDFSLTAGFEWDSIFSLNLATASLGSSAEAKRKWEFVRVVASAGSTALEREEGKVSCWLEWLWSRVEGGLPTQDESGQRQQMECLLWKLKLPSSWSRQH